MALFYQDQPVFGFDIGRGSIKIMQIDPLHKKKQSAVVRAYGNTTFDPRAIDKGMIVEPEIIVQAAHELITKNLVGKLTTRHVALSLPNSYSFSRIVNLPPDIEGDDITSAIEAELAESIPVPITDLYYDYELTTQREDGQCEYQVVASQTKIVDSYIDVVRALGLTPAVLEPNINSVTRTVVRSEVHEAVSLIADLGSNASDIAVYDGTVVRATGTIDCGGENITRAIAGQLRVSLEQANSIKSRYGLEVSKKQSEILSAVDPELERLLGEIRKVIRYYSERATEDRQIGQIIILGGGANLPGLAGYITNKARVPTRLNAPWTNLTFGSLQAPHELETTLYTTAAGLTQIMPGEIA